MKKKIALVLLALVLVVGATIGGTLAWLTASTTEVKNTFTTADINITLTETFNAKSKEGLEENDIWQAQMIPGYSYTKDPVVTVTANSVDCYLFVKFEEKNVSTTTKDGATFNYLGYTSNLTTDNGWKKLTGVDGVDNVWYREVASSNENQAFHLLKDDNVSINDDLTKELMPENGKAPELVYTAYATQLYKNVNDKFTAADAWAKIGN